jgi:hypothetical protein
MAIFKLVLSRYLAIYGAPPFGGWTKSHRFGRFFFWALLRKPTVDSPVILHSFSLRKPLFLCFLCVLNSKCRYLHIELGYIIYIIGSASLVLLDIHAGFIDSRDLPSSTQLWCRPDVGRHFTGNSSIKIWEISKLDVDSVVHTCGCVSID